MTTYIYETIPAKPGGKTRHYEIRQSMKESALKKHPETGEPIRRVVTGGFGLLKSGKSGSAPAARAQSCGSGGCGCC